MDISNLLNISTITPKVTSLSLSNPINSNKLLKISSIVYSGRADGTGGWQITLNNTIIAFGDTVESRRQNNVIQGPIYLTEGSSITTFTSPGGGVTGVISYEEIS